MKTKLIRIILIFSIMLLILPDIANGATYTNTFPESTSRNQSHTITLPNLQSITSVGVNTGSVNYTVNGDRVSLNFSGGSASRIVQTGGSFTPADSRTQTGSQSSTYTSFEGGSTICHSRDTPTSMSYNSGGYSGTLSRTSFTPTGSVSYQGDGTTRITCSAQYSGTVTRPGSDTRTYQYYYQYRVTINYVDNRVPTLTLSSNLPSVVSKAEGHNQLRVSGFVQDPDNDNVTVTTTFQGHTKSTVVSNTTVQRPFSIDYDMFDYPDLQNGVHPVRVVASDGKGGSVTRTFNVTVADYLTDNKYVLIDDLLLMLTKYQDAESDAIHQHNFRIRHNPQHFENYDRTTGQDVTRNTPYEQTRSGVISFHDQWTLPSNYQLTQGAVDNPQAWYTAFKTVGHYEISYRAKDNPKDDDKFDEFRYWSPPTPPLNIYVHRKPVAHFEAYMNINTGAVMIRDNAHDLDSYSLGEKGIKEKQWSHRQVGSTTWFEGKPASLDRTQNHEIRQIVTDFQGETDEYIERVDRVTAFPNQPPIAGFSIIGTPYFVGDTINVHVDGTDDPDRDPLEISFALYYQSSDNLLQRKVFDNVQHPYDFTFSFDEPISDGTHGKTYIIVQTVSDGYYDPVQTSLTFTPLDLEVLGEVHHTERWNKHRIQYNLSKTGTEDDPRTYDVFFPGERFILRSETVGPAVNVDVEIIDHLYSTVLQSTGIDVWGGDIWDERMISWRDGTITFRFTATFENGLTRAHDVPIIIDDDSYWRQRRHF